MHILAQNKSLNLIWFLILIRGAAVITAFIIMTDESWLLRCMKIRLKERLTERSSEITMNIWEE